MFTHQGQTDRGETSAFENVGQHADGVRTQRSRGGEEHHVDSLVLEALRYLGSGLVA
jgi:hypothetical protein